MRVRRARTDPRDWQVLLKRLLSPAPASDSGERRANVIVTGEALGRVPFQTP